MFKFPKMLLTARDGDRMLKLYERALNSANRYLPVMLGPGSAMIASAMLNEILCDDVLKGNGVEEFRVENRNIVEKKAKDVLKNDPLLRELMIHTLWVKWILDKAFNRDSAVTALEGGWAFKTYSSQYPPMPLREYQGLVTNFEEQTALELGKYLEAHSKGVR